MGGCGQAGQGLTLPAPVGREGGEYRSTGTGRISQGRVFYENTVSGQGELLEWEQRARGEADR